MLMNRLWNFFPRFRCAYFKKKLFFSEKKNHLFVDKSKFSPNEIGLLIYKSNEKPIYLLFSASFLVFFGYFSNKAFKEHEESNELGSNFYIGGLFLIGSLLLQWKINKTIKNVYLDINGKICYFDLYRLGGITSKGLKIENKLMKGPSVFFPKILKDYHIPIINLSEEGQKNYFFFKTDFVLEYEIFKYAITGNEFLVSDDKSLSITLSKKKKSNYKL